MNPMTHGPGASLISPQCSLVLDYGHCLTAPISGPQIWLSLGNSAPDTTPKPGATGPSDQPLNYPPLRTRLPKSWILSSVRRNWQSCVNRLDCSAGSYNTYQPKGVGIRHFPITDRGKAQGDARNRPGELQADCGNTPSTGVGQA